MSRLSARLARLAVVLIGLILIGLAVLHLPPVRARVLDRVRGYAQREFGIALQASSLGYNLLTRSIELRDLSLAATSNGQPFFKPIARSSFSIQPSISVALMSAASRSRGRASRWSGTQTAV